MDDRERRIGVVIFLVFVQTGQLYIRDKTSVFRLDRQIVAPIRWRVHLDCAKRVECLPLYFSVTRARRFVVARCRGFVGLRETITLRNSGNVRAYHYHTVIVGRSGRALIKHCVNNFEVSNDEREPRFPPT